MNTHSIRMGGCGIVSVIGKTPLVELSNIVKNSHFRLFAKLEALNPGGSTKDRPAVWIIRHGLETGAIRSNTVVVESSSGNMGIGLAQACSYYGIRFICVLDPKATAQNVRLMKAYGAEVDIVQQPDPVTGEFLQARINRVKDLLSSIENSYWPNQYTNLYNPKAHYMTMREIVSALERAPDFLFCATSTCGTMRGCAEYVRAHNYKTKVYAVDAEGSVIFGGVKAKRLISGHGAAIVPQLFKSGLADKSIQVSDLECVIGCRRLAKSEAIVAGGSSGAIISAIERVKESIHPGALCVAILPDRGERYLDTIYCDGWVNEHFGDVSHLWRM
jgi:N-(2-amino-2-carboxyethyl)-L-glutamate synthase